MWNSTLKRAFKFIENLSGARIRPRCLILHFDIKYLGGRIYEELLIELWQKKFPNVDILRIVKKNILNNLKLSLEENVTLHSYNDFTKKYLEEKFSLDTNMFPDKFQDLNGHQLLVGEDALFSKEHLNSHNSKSIIKIISKALNLSMKVRYKLEKDIWKPNPENKKIITRLENGEFDLLKFLRPMIGKAETDNYETTNFVESRELVAVVPILTRELHFLPVTQNFIFSMIFIISLLLLLLIIARLFRFDSEFSHPMNIMQLIYGLSTSCSLQKLQEKILFFFIFLAYILYSSSIFQEMTQIFIHSQEEIKFSNIEELNKTNLVPLFKSHREKSNAMAEAIDSDFFPFLNKSLKHANCLSILIEFKNVTCLYPKDQAEIEIYKQLSIYSDVRMKIVKENLLSSYRSLKLAPGSPLVAKFDEIILRILETGLKRVRDLRWSQKVKTATSIEDRRKEIEVGTIKKEFLIFILICHLISIFVFIAEVLHAN